MKKKFSDSAAPAAARKAVPGPDRLSPVTPHRQSSLPMPGAAPSPAIDFLSPDVIRWKRANLERDWIDAAAAFGQPDFTPDRAPELAFYLMLKPQAERQEMAQALPAELFTVLCVAAEQYNMTGPQSCELVAAFPGLREVFEIAMAHHGHAEMSDALGLPKLH